MVSVIDNYRRFSRHRYEHADRGHTRLDIQGLRMVAVLTVFAFHLTGWPRGGFVGVDVFFVISGFLITGNLMRTAESTGSISFVQFYMNRIRRIVPAATTVLIVTYAVGVLVFQPSRAQSIGVDAVFAFLFFANWHFAIQETDYFAETASVSPIQHYWSLSIEEQFYFVWPALIFLVSVLVVRRSWTHARRMRLAGIVMAIIVVSSLTWALRETAESPTWAYFNTFSRVWELGVGALLATSLDLFTRISDLVRPLLSWGGLGLTVASLLLIDQSSNAFPAPWALLPVAGAALVIVAGVGHEPRCQAFLRNPASTYLGDISYSLYLVHWPVIVIVGAFMETTWSYYLMVVALAFALAIASYHLVENPLRRANMEKLRAVTRKIRMPALQRSAWAVIGGAAATLVVMSILFIQYSDRLAAAETEVARAQKSTSQGMNVSPTGSAERPDPCFGAPALVTPGCTLRNPDKPLQPSIDKFSDDYPTGVTDCFTLKNAPMRSCQFGYDGPDAKRIALVGDSHAAFLIPALQPSLKANRWRLTTFVGTPCALADPSPEGCRETMMKAESELIAHPFDLVLIVNRNNGQDPAAYQRAWAPIAAKGSKFAVVLDNPESSDEALSCITRVTIGRDHTGECGTLRDYALRHTDPLAAAAKLVPGTSVIDLTRFFCTADRCPSVIGDVIVYFDKTHITATFSRTLAEPLEEAIRSALAH